MRSRKPNSNPNANPNSNPNPNWASYYEVKEEVLDDAEVAYREQQGLLAKGGLAAAVSSHQNQEGRGEAAEKPKYWEETPPGTHRSEAKSEKSVRTVKSGRRSAGSPSKPSSVSSGLFGNLKSIKRESNGPNG